jgi:lysophospholipase L1-like esterase
MNRTIKLLSAAVVILFILAGVEAYVIQTTPLVASKPEPIRVACVGDSLTRGTEYTLFLWDHLGPSYIISDFGVGGTTVSLSSDKPYMNQSAFQMAQSFQPNVVIIMLGTNDAGLSQSTDAFKADYTTLVHTFQTLPSKPAVFIVQPPPIANSTILSNSRLAGTLIPAIGAVAAQTGATLVDAYTPMLNHESTYTDGVHFNADGAKIVANAIYASLNRAGYS